MTKIEALKAAIDGKKVSHRSWDSKFYVIWDGSIFKTEAGEPYYFKHSCNVDWFILPELVSFNEAWKAYEEGKAIKSVKWSSVNFIKKEVCNEKGWAFDPDFTLAAHEIRGDWQILD